MDGIYLHLGSYHYRRNLSFSFYPRDLKPYFNRNTKPIHYCFCFSINNSNWCLYRVCLKLIILNIYIAVVKSLYFWNFIYRITLLTPQNEHMAVWPRTLLIPQSMRWLCYTKIESILYYKYYWNILSYNIFLSILFHSFPGT